MSLITQATKDCSREDKVAQALYEADGGAAHQWLRCWGPARERWLMLARAAIAAIESALFVEREITIKLAPRDDGGLRVWSDDLPGLALSGRVQEFVLLDLGPALVGLLEQK